VFPNKNNLRKGNRDLLKAFYTARETEEVFERQMRLRLQGYDLQRLAQKVYDLVGVDPLRERGRYRMVVQARRVFCYWAGRDLGMSGAMIAKELGITQPAVSMAVKEGENIVRERRWKP
jgi:biotin operon repressor